MKQEYDLLPLKYVDTIHFVDNIVYCYRIGRGEQSVSLAGLEKHYAEQTIVLKRLYKEFKNFEKKATAKDIYQFAGKMMDDYGLSGYTIHPYGGK